MTDKLVEWARTELKGAEMELNSAAALIDRLRKAGENVAVMERDHAAAREKLDRYKKAFAD